MAISEAVPAALDGERLDRVVAMMCSASRSEVARWIEERLIRCNDEVVTARSHRVREGDRIDVAVDVGAGGPPALEPDPSVEVPVVYEDDDLVVVDKPAGSVVHPGAGNARGTLVQGLLARYPEMAAVGDPARPGIVQRLDKDTSGLMVVARRAEAYDELVRQLGAREVERRYLTLVWGAPTSSSGLVDAPIGRSAREPTRMAVSAQGREARTRYEVREVFSQPAEVALLECRLETGRTHQIRVHLAAIGHPVVGDDRYGGARAALAVPRMFLHATHLAFEHPCRPGERLELDAPLPPDLQEVLDSLGS